MATLAKKLDPTDTTLIRRQFIAEVNRRFTQLSKAITDALVTQDMLGLKEKVNPLKMLARPGNFQFSSNPEKHQGFMDWLKEQETFDILGTVKPGPTGKSSRWTDGYIQSAYKKSIAQSYSFFKANESKLKEVQPDIPGLIGPDPQAFINHSMLLPIHKDAVEMLYTRTYSDLKGITNVMDAGISRVLSQGISEGQNPNVLARKMRDTVSGIGIARARMIARTEVIRAHAESKLNTFQALGLEDVEVEAEWSTADDERVCPKCHAMEGKVFTLAGAREMLPLHPNCRCTWIPHLPDLSEEKPEEPVKEPETDVEEGIPEEEMGIPEVEWTMPERARRSGDKVVWVDVEAFDRLWKKDPEMYVAPGGVGGIKGRYERFGKFLETGESVIMSEVGVSPRTGTIEFTNGRHRFAYLRDHGVKTIPISMDKSMMKLAKKTEIIVKAPKNKKMGTILTTK